MMAVLFSSGSDRDTAATLAAATFDFDLIGSSGRRRDLNSSVLGVGEIHVFGVKTAGFEFFCLSTISKYLR